MHSDQKARRKDGPAASRRVGIEPRRRIGLWLGFQVAKRDRPAQQIALGSDHFAVVWASQKSPRDSLGLRGRTQHLDLHRGVERPPGLPQLRGKRRAELALKAPHQRLAHCGILRWLNAKSGVLAT